MSLSPVQLLLLARDCFGDRLAVVDGDHRFTYVEFIRRCEGLAAALQALGVGRGDTVAFRSYNTHRMLEAYFAPALIGAACLPVNARLAKPEVDRILSQAEPKLYWTEPFPAIDYSGRPQAVDVEDGETAAIYYTSGTTGEPKPVRLSHRNLYLHALALSAAAERRTDAVELQIIPLFHANGWGRPLLSVLQGNTTVLCRRFQPSEALRLIHQESVTDVALVPTMARDLLDQAGRFGPSTLREIHLGGSMPSFHLIESLRQRFECRVSVGYGMTEANSAITYDGIPLPGVEARVESDGEIFLQGPTIVSPGWFATGDLGRWTEEGRLGSDRPEEGHGYPRRRKHPGARGRAADRRAPLGE